MMSGSNAGPAATVSVLAADAGTNGYAFGTSKRALVDKAMESARCDSEEHVTKDSTFYPDDLEKMKDSFEATARSHLRRIVALETELGPLRARPSSAASGGNGAAVGNAVPAACGKGRGRGRGHSAAALVGAAKTMRLAAFQW